MKPLIIAIAGGTASGKSTVVKEIVESLKSVDISVICHDDYYKDQSHLTMEQRLQTNYDHPNSLDNDLLAKGNILISARAAAKNMSAENIAAEDADAEKPDVQETEAGKSEAEPQNTEPQNTSQEEDDKK